jgi:hypothetical protein
MSEEIRASELTAHYLGRRVKIDPGDQTIVTGYLVNGTESGWCSASAVP